MNKAAPLVAKTNDLTAKASFYEVRGSINLNKKQYQQAIEDFGVAYKTGQDNDDTYKQIALIDPLIKALIAAGKMAEAKKMNDTLLQKSISFKMPSGQVNAYDNSARLSFLQKDYESAYRFLDQKMRLSDSISSDEMRKK